MSDDLLREEQMRDPKVRARLRAIFEDAKDGNADDGITAEELPDFLRDHGIPSSETRSIFDPCYDLPVEADGFLFFEHTMIHIPGCMGCAVYGHERCTCPADGER